LNDDNLGASGMNRRNFLTSAIYSAALLTLPSLPARAQDGSRRIVIGQTADLSGSMQNIGRDYFTGAKLVFDQANAGSGPSFGHIRFVQIDDGGNPATAVANTRQLLEEERADLLFGLTSEACVEAVTTSPAFRASDVCLFAPVTGIDHPGGKGRVVYLRPNYVDEMNTIIGRLTDLSLTRFALIHTSSDSVVAARNAILGGLQGRLTADAILPLALQNGAANIASLIDRMSKAQTQAAIFLGDSITTAQAIKQIRARMPVLFICLSSTVDAVLVRQMLNPRLAQGLMVSRVVPDPDNGIIPVVQDFKRAQKKYLDETLSPAGLEGFIAAQALLSILRKGDNPRNLVFTAQRRVGMLDLGGWKVNLAANRASTRIEIAMISTDGRLI